MLKKNFAQVLARKIMGEGEDNILVDATGRVEFKLKKAWSYGLFKYSVNKASTNNAFLL